MGEAATLSYSAVWESIGGLSQTSKMPGPGWSISAMSCPMHAKYGHIEGSVCSTCYARKGRYGFGPVQKCLLRREAALRDDPEWVQKMARLISGAKNSEFFRWHDSGELLDGAHLRKVVQVVERTRQVRHWLPTRNLPLVRKLLKEDGRMPKNLTVRLSGIMVGQEKVPDGGTGLPTSTVVRKGMLVGKGTILCRASLGDGTCGNCRACWDIKVPQIGYIQH